MIMNFIITNTRPAQCGWAGWSFTSKQPGQSPGLPGSIAAYDDDILKAVHQGKLKVQKAMEELGLKEALKDWWEEPSDKVQVQVEMESNEDDSEDEDDEAENGEDGDDPLDMTNDKKMIGIGFVTSDSCSKI